MVADIKNGWNPNFLPQILQGPPADDGQVDLRKITQFFQLSLDFRGAKSQVRSGNNRSEGSIVVQEKYECLGLPHPGLNVFPIIEKMFHETHSQQ